MEAWNFEQVERYEYLVSLDTLTEQEQAELENLSNNYLAYERYLWGVE